MPGDAGLPGETEGAGGGDEPGFEDGVAAGEGGGDALPDMRDEPSLEDSMGAFEDAMGGPPPGGQPGGSQPGGGSPGSTAGTAGQGPNGSQPPGGNPGGTGAYSIPGMPGMPGSTPGTPGGQGQSGSGTLTPAEQVAILDAQLESGTGEFDAMILEEQAAQRRAAREQAARRPPPVSAEESGEGGAPEGGMADSGGYSTGGGMPGAGAPGGGIGGGGIPQNTAKYPPPANIPSGSDDDVVARQLREAAMREPDPAVREKLWAEYRKYKGISS
jgi:hypothetical protein